MLSLGAVIGGEFFSGSSAPEEAVGQPYPVGGGAPPTSNVSPAVAPFEGFGRPRAVDADAEIIEEVGEEGGEDLSERIAAHARAAQGVHIVATRLCESDTATAALIGFARSLARDGRPIIIDLDARAGQVAPLMGSRSKMNEMAGLTDLLDGKASFADVIHRDQASRLHYVPFGSAESFNHSDLDVILDALAQTYDFVLLAAPPFTTSEMPKALAPYADFVVLAMPADQDHAATKAAREDLAAAGAAEILVIGGAKEAA